MLGFLPNTRLQSASATQPLKLISGRSAPVRNSMKIAMAPAHLSACKEILKVAV